MAYLLVVDDDGDFAGAVAMVLRDQGHEVDIENDAEKTIARVTARRPDAIILDVMFPENDTAGFEIARALRRKFGALPVLLLTAVNQQFPLGFSNQDIDPTWLPAAEFLEKPIDFKVVLAKVSAILAAPSARPIADNQP